MSLPEMNEAVLELIRTAIASAKAAEDNTKTAAEDVSAIKAYLLDIRKDIGELGLAVRGDGNGEHGLVIRTDRLEKSLDFLLTKEVVGSKAINPQRMAQWVAIGAGVIAYVVEILLPAWR